VCLICVYRVMCVLRFCGVCLSCVYLFGVVVVFGVCVCDVYVVGVLCFVCLCVCVCVECVVRVFCAYVFGFRMVGL